MKPSNPFSPSLYHIIFKHLDESPFCCVLLGLCPLRSTGSSQDNDETQAKRNDGGRLGHLEDGPEALFAIGTQMRRRALWHMRVVDAEENSQPIGRQSFSSFFIFRPLLRRRRMRLTFQRGD